MKGLSWLAAEVAAEVAVPLLGSPDNSPVPVSGYRVGVEEKCMVETVWLVVGSQSAEANAFGVAAPRLAVVRT